LTGLAAFFITRNEPVHGGKTVGQWLKIAEDPFISAAERATADKAISRIGSNAIPVLLKKLKSNDRYRQPAANLWNKFANRVLPSSWYSKLYVKAEKAFDNHQQGQHGFRIIGTNALLSINPFRAPEFGVITNDVPRYLFEGYLRRASQAQTNSSGQK